MRKLLVMLGVLAFVSNEGAPRVYSAENAAPAGQPANGAKVARAKKIVATGTVEPEQVFSVHSQVTGAIIAFGTDAAGKPIDYGSAVEAGTILAQIDSVPYAARAERELAGCQRAEAERAQAKLNLERAETLWKRAQDQQKNKAISDSDLDTAKFDYKAAEAAVAVAEAVVAQGKAALKQAEIELGYTTIESPSKGIVIDRGVNMGQIVAPTVNGSVFLIGKIDKLDVWASVNEADISQIREQQPVRFTVDAYPGKVFEGKVRQIRLNATMTQNVVTYTVVVAISSPTEKLLPYMTANLQFD